MKRFFLLLFSCIFLNMYSQTTVSLGNFTKFPDDKSFGILYKPSIAFGQFGSIFVLSLKVVQADNYALFDSDSRLLFKFEDEGVVKLPILFDIGITHNFDNMVSGISYYKFYTTYTSYELNEEFVDRIVNKEQKIKKIRIVFSNGEAIDYDINKKYMKKLTYGLKESYYRVISKQQEKQKILQDEDF